MRVKDLQELFDYSRWANARLFSAASSLSAEEFCRPVAGSYGSIRNTLVHSMSAEWGWVDRCGGTPRGKRLDPEDYPTLQSVVDRWHKVDGYVRDLLSRLSDEDLERKIEFSLEPTKTYSMRIGELLLHAAIHGVHHRAQVSLLLRMLDTAPGNVDALIYYAERREPAAAAPTPA